MNEVSCIFWHILILTEINDEDLEHLGFLFIAKGWSTSRNIPGIFLEKGTQIHEHWETHVSFLNIFFYRIMLFLSLLEVRVR